MSFRNIVFAVILPVLVLSGCILPRTEKKSLDCPEPEQGCVPGEWSGLEIDTTKISEFATGYRVVIAPVKGVNTPGNEWGFSFIDDKRAVFSFDDNDRQSVMIARKAVPDRYFPTSGLYIPLSGQYGSMSFADNKVFASIITETEELDVPEEIRNNMPEDELFIDDSLQILLPVTEMLGQSRIYTADFQDKKFSKMNDLSDALLFDIYTWNSQPAVSNDGNYLIFASDRPGGFGGTDLWFSLKMNDGKWSKPINLGPKINSSCDELTPFLDKDLEYLYFASSGHETLGGYDLFKSKIDKFFKKLIADRNINGLENSDLFSEPENLRPPLNTPADELFPSCPGDCDSIFYYSSNQAGEAGLVAMKGGFDIYVRHRYVPLELLAERSSRNDNVEVPITFGEEPKPNITTPEIEFENSYIIRGGVYNARTKEAVSGGKIRIIKTAENKIIFSQDVNENGQYESEKLDKNVEYEIIAEAPSLFYESYSFIVYSEDTTTVLEKDFYLLEKLVLRINFPSDAYNNPYTFTLDSDGIQTSKTWKDEIQILADNIMLSSDKLEKVILTGHTDDVGTEEYNNGLGMRRVNFVIDELVKRGVPRELLEAKSAGELEPLDKREDEDITHYRKRLRRVALQKIYK